MSFSKSGIVLPNRRYPSEQGVAVAKAMLMAILCSSYKTGVTALSKLNLVRKILAHVSQQSRMIRRLRTGEGGNRQHGSLAASQTIDLHKAPVRT